MPEDADKHDSRLQHAPSATRNSAVILEVLKKHLPETGRALEIASGSGQHAAAFAITFPGIDWFPSDPDERARDSITAWSEDAGAENLNPPLDIDVTRALWHGEVEGPFNALLAINMHYKVPESRLVDVPCLFGPCHVVKLRHRVRGSTLGPPIGRVCGGDYRRRGELTDGHMVGMSIGPLRVEG